MKKFLIIIAALALSILIALAVLGQLSRSGKAPGLVDGRLTPCPDSPNCVCSEYPGAGDHYIEPIETALSSAALQAAIAQLGGRVETISGSYLAASFRSPLFGFVDDFESRLDSDAGLLHLRSASRVGRSDFGANRKRLEQLRQLLQQRTATQN